MKNLLKHSEKVFVNCYFPLFHFLPDGLITIQGTTVANLVARLLAVVDLLQRDGARCKEVSQFGQVDAVPKPLLQLRGGRELLVQTRLHPPVGGEHIQRGSFSTLRFTLKLPQYLPWASYWKYESYIQIWYHTGVSTPRKTTGWIWNFNFSCKYVNSTSKCIARKIQSKKTKQNALSNVKAPWLFTVKKRKKK